MHLLTQIWLIYVYYYDTQIVFTKFKTEDHALISSPTNNNS